MREPRAHARNASNKPHGPLPAKLMGLVQCPEFLLLKEKGWARMDAVARGTHGLGILLGGNKYCNPTAHDTLLVRALKVQIYSEDAAGVTW